MDQKRRYICYLLAVFSCLLFCYLAVGGSDRLQGHTDVRHAVVWENSAFITPVSTPRVSQDIQRSESLLRVSFFDEERVGSSLNGLMRSLAFLCILSCFSSALQWVKASLFAFLANCFILIRYPVHIIDTVHRKDGKKRSSASF